MSIGQPTRLYRFTGPRMEELNRLFGGGESDGVKGTKPPIAPEIAPISVGARAFQEELEPVP